MSETNDQQTPPDDQPPPDTEVGAVDQAPPVIVDATAEVPPAVPVVAGDQVEVAPEDPEPAFPDHLRFESGHQNDFVEWLKQWVPWHTRQSR